MFIPITKVDVAQRLVYGTLTEEVADKSNEIIDYATAKPAFEKWSQEIFDATKGKSKGNVRAMHGSIAAGKFTDISYDDEAKRIEGCAKIVDDGEWAKVLEGVYTGFSIGGGYAKRWQDPSNPKLKRYTPTLSEISIVDNPCVASATFDLIKTDGSVEMRKFITPTKEDSMTTAEQGGAAADKAAPEAEDALNKATEAKAEEPPADPAQADAPKEETVEKTEAKPDLVKDGKPLKPSTAPMQKWVASDGATFDSKREAEVHNLQLEKQVELAPGLAQMEALLNKSEEAKPEEKTEEKPDAVAKAAEPVKEPEAKVAAEPAKVEKAAEAPLKKGLYGIGQLASILSDINCFMTSAEWEAMSEGDGSTIPAQVKAWLKQGAALLNTYCAEETSELFDDEDVEILAMAAKMDAPKANALVKFAKEGKVKAELGKAGARHSKTDKESLMALHKSASDHLDAMEKCFKGMGIMADDSDEDKSAKKMSKVIDSLNEKTDELIVVSKIAASSNEALLKAVPLIENLQKQNAELTKRVATIEAQPMPGKGHVKVISKAQDSGGTGDGNAEAEFKAQLEKMSPEARANELMKLALANPMTISQ